VHLLMEEELPKTLQDRKEDNQDKRQCNSHPAHHGLHRVPPEVRIRPKEVKGDEPKLRDKGSEFRDSRLVPSYKHLPVNLRLQKRASKRVRVAKSREPQP
jgi:hypothetical protein